MPPSLLLFACWKRRATALTVTQPARLFSTSLPAMSADQHSPRRSYEDALALLKTLQSNKAIRTEIADGAKQDVDPNARAIPEMVAWTRRAGYEAAELGKHGQRYIHVAGTKGKGSVSVMVESLLLYLRNSPPLASKRDIGKAGLYTSPHLVTVRERIRIDGHPISESMFTKYFFELWDRFGTVAADDKKTPDILSETGEIRPGYFRYLTILAFHTFIKEGVNTAIFECGIGGEYDSTNILPADAVAVSAITSLGIDHTAMLGNTIEEISWHKAGIMKKGVPIYTVPQRPEALAVLEKRATEKDISLRVVQRIPEIEAGEVELGLLGDFQKDNASLAVAVAASYVGQESLPIASIQEPLNSVSWPGRCEIRKDGNVEWFIDGAHTVDSIKAASTWFGSQVQKAHQEHRPPTARMLIFNQEERDGQELLRHLLSPDILRSDILMSSSIFRYAAFCSNEPFASSGKKDLTIQERLGEVYQYIDRNPLHQAYGSVEEAVQLARRVSEGDERVLVLVTGSLHLVGGLLQVFEREERENFKLSATQGFSGQKFTGGEDA